MTDGSSISVLQRFAEQRKLNLPPQFAKVVTSGSSKALAAAAPASPSRVPTRQPIWSTYTKRTHGERVDRLRDAIRIPEEDYSDSRDAYCRKKKPKVLIKLHEEAGEWSVAFEKRTRRLGFQREVVDRPVCDLIENRSLFHQRLHEIAEELDGGH